MTRIRNTGTPGDTRELRGQQGNHRPPGPLPVPLSVHSAFSLLRGASGVEDLVRRAAHLGFDTLALTDRDNLYGAVAFLKAAESEGVRPILGAEVTDADAPPEGRSGALSNAANEAASSIGPVPSTAPPNAPTNCPASRHATRPASRTPADPRGIERGAALPARSVLLLVREAAGYASLCRILTRRRMDPGFRLLDALAEHRDGLLALCEHADLLEPLVQRMGKNSVAAVLLRPSHDSGGEQRRRERRVAEEAWRLGVPLAAGPRVYMASPQDWERHRLLAAIRENDLVTRLSPEHLAPQGSWLPTPAEIFALFHDRPGSLAAARDLAESCRFSMNDLRRRGTLLPRLPLPSGESAYDRLFRMVQDGIRSRYRTVTPEVTRRMAHELAMIEEMGFTDYFLVVGDLVAAACDRGIPTVGRGSGAGSIITYALGVTNVDPIQYDLTFERFLHRLRTDCPDLDIDLCWKGRDSVIEHVYETYGRDRVAMISVHNCFGMRGALRETAKAYGVDPDDVHAAPTLREMARQLVGLPHTLGIHCGGIVIGPGPLDQWVPLEEATKGIVVTQYEMRAVEEIGLVKIDLLGSRALSTLREAAVWIGRDAARGREKACGKDSDEGFDGVGCDEPPFDLDAIPDPDPETGALLSQGQSLGCFQIESPGMRNLLRMLGTDDLSGTIAALSLIRPGPASSGMKERYVRRSRGLEPVTYHHPSLEPLLASTYGVMLFEEDVIRVASAIAGIPRDLADLLRRAIGAAASVQADPSLGERGAPGRASEPGEWPRPVEDPWKGNDLRGIESRFLEQAVRNGIDIRTAHAVWIDLARFGCYAFCKAHASGYGVLAWRTAWLKAHHPGPLFAALLNNHQGMYPKRVHVEEARRRGVMLRPPSVLHSETGWTWDGEALRCGLGQVRGLSSATRERILTARADGAFDGVADFWRRTRASAPEVEALILCGGLDDVERGPRPALLWRYHALHRKGGVRACAAAEPAGPGLWMGRAAGAAAHVAANARAGAAAPAIGTSAASGHAWSDFTLQQRIAHELTHLDVAISGHPIMLLQEDAQVTAPVRAAGIDRMIGQRVRFTGITAAMRRVRTQKDEPMLFLTLEDETGLLECTLFPKVFARHGRVCRESWALRVVGRVEDQLGAAMLDVERVEGVGIGVAEGQVAAGLG